MSKYKLGEIPSRIADLFKIKSIMSIAAVYVFIKLSVTGVFAADQIMLIIVMVFQAFFQYQSNKPKDGGEQ